VTQIELEEHLQRYTAKDLLSLTPGKRIMIYVSQENIDNAIVGDKRNCAFVRAIHSAIESAYRAEVAGNHVYIWIEHGNEKWELEFYMTEEVWTLASTFDEDRTLLHPTTLPIHFRAGKQKNRQRQTSRAVHKYRPDLPGVTPRATVESQVLSKSEGKAPETNLSEAKPVVKPISVPGSRPRTPNGPPKSRWAREDFYVRN